MYSKCCWWLCGVDALRPELEHVHGAILRRTGCRRNKFYSSLFVAKTGTNCSRLDLVAVSDQCTGFRELVVSSPAEAFLFVLFFFSCKCLEVFFARRKEDLLPTDWVLLLPFHPLANSSVQRSVSEWLKELSLFEAKSLRFRYQTPSTLVCSGFALTFL